MEKIYTTRATATGGRNGHVTSENGELDIDVRMPGTPGKFLNPEILFAAGYAACFDNALIGMLRQQKIIANVTHQTTVEVSLGKLDNGSYSFEITISVQTTGLARPVAEQLIEKAHQVCPYSNAVRGNVATTLIINPL